MLLLEFECINDHKSSVCICVKSYFRFYFLKIIFWSRNMINIEMLNLKLQGNALSFKSLIISPLEITAADILLSSNLL